MKPTNATLNALLATREFFTADLYTITLTGGTVLRYCSGPSDINDGTNTYAAGGVVGPYFDRKDNRAKVSWKLGVGSDSLVIDVLPGSSTVLGLPFLSACVVGTFDGADFALSRAFMATYGTVQTGCSVLMFKGRIAEIDASRSMATMTVNDYRELFNQNMPREIYAASCANTLYDANCTVNPALFSDPGTVLIGSTSTKIFANLPHGTGFYDLGKLTFTSGALNGLTVGVSSWVAGTPGSITLIIPTAITPAAADTFTIYAGCDRTLGNGGCAKFANQANFRGFPYVPAPETAA